MKNISVFIKENTSESNKLEKIAFAYSVCYAHLFITVIGEFNVAIYDFSIREN